jgi:hypothetical protein
MGFIVTFSYLFKIYFDHVYSPMILFCPSTNLLHPSMYFFFNLDSTYEKSNICLS